MNNNPSNKIAERDAKAGRRVKGMTTVLVVSTVAAVIVVMAVFALNVKP